jgi:hypothetical protein
MAALPRHPEKQAGEIMSALQLSLPEVYRRMGAASGKSHFQTLGLSSDFLRPEFPFWAGFPYLVANLLASGLSGKSNGEIRRGSQFLNQRLVLDQRCPKS